jgi:putative membrane protein
MRQAALTPGRDPAMSDLNDPRVFFAAERTLLAWNRTALALMAFGFVIERFGLFMRLLMAPGTLPTLTSRVSLWIGIAFILMGSAVSVIAVRQYRKVLDTLKPVEIPEGYRVNLGVVTNLAVAMLGVVLTLYLFQGT